MEILLLGHSIEYVKKSQDDIDLYNNNQKLTYKSLVVEVEKSVISLYNSNQNSDTAP